MKTVATFLDPKQILVETPKGDRYTLGFNTSFNYQLEEQDGRFLKAIAYFFDECFKDRDKHLYGDLNRFLLQHRFESIFFFHRDHIQTRASIGERIRTLREQKNFDVETLAQKANIQPNTLVRIEAGRFSATFDILAQIAQGLGMKLDFVELENDKENGSTI